MSSEDQDFIDKIFSTGYSLFVRGNKAIADATNKVIDSVTHNIDLGQNERGYNGKKIVENNNGSIPGALKWILERRRSIYWGIGATAVGVVLYWQFEHLIKVPSRLRQSQKKCVLVLGDMRDPIIRSQVMDLYRRRFVVFVCTSRTKDKSEFDNHHEEDDFLRFLDADSSSDLAQFIDFVSKKGEDRCELASILFMPNLSYYPSGEMSTRQLDAEIHSNVLLYYATLKKLLPYLKGSVTQVLLFNPSLSFNLAVSHHPVEIIVSGLIQSIYRTLKGHHRLSVYMIHIGLLQIAAQPSNYKYLGISGSHINKALLQPVYELISVHHGNSLQKIIHWIKTIGSLNRNVYCGGLSYISTFPFAKIFALRLF